MDPILSRSRRGATRLRRERRRFADLSTGVAAGKNPVGSFITDTAGAILDLPADLLRQVTN